MWTHLTRVANEIGLTVKYTYLPATSVKMRKGAYIVYVERKNRVITFRVFQNKNVKEPIIAPDTVLHDFFRIFSTTEQGEHHLLDWQLKEMVRYQKKFKDILGDEYERVVRAEALDRAERNEAIKRREESDDDD